MPFDPAFQYGETEPEDDLRAVQRNLWRNRGYTPAPKPGQAPVTYDIDAYLSMHLRPSGEQILTTPTPWIAYRTNLPGNRYGQDN